MHNLLAFIGNHLLFWLPAAIVVLIVLYGLIAAALRDFGKGPPPGDDFVGEIDESDIAPFQPLGRIADGVVDDLGRRRS